MTTVQQIMTPDPIVLSASEPLSAAAEKMRDGNVGDILVEKDGSLCGIITDRDLVIRAMAEGKDPSSFTIGETCTTDLTTVSPDDDASEAITRMRRDSIRRLPVVDEGVAVGVVSLGDLAERFDTESLLGAISSDAPQPA